MGLKRLEVQYNHLGLYDNHGDFALLIKYYELGDCDTISWPLTEKGEENLVPALFDVGEMGYLTDESYETRKVLLPDGREFDFS